MAKSGQSGLHCKHSEALPYHDTPTVELFLKMRHWKFWKAIWSASTKIWSPLHHGSWICQGLLFIHPWTLLVDSVSEVSAVSSRSCMCCVMGKNCFKGFWAASVLCEVIIGEYSGVLNDCLAYSMIAWGWLAAAVQIYESGMKIYERVVFYSEFWKFLATFFKDVVIWKRIDFWNMMKVLAWSLKDQKAFWVDQEMSHTNNHFLLEMQGRSKKYDCSRDI